MFRLDEQETVIQYGPTDDTVHFFSTIPSMVRKYRKIASENGLTPIRDEEDLIELDIPKNLFRVSVRKPRNLTEEQREKKRELMLAYHRAKREDSDHS